MAKPEDDAEALGLAALQQQFNDLRAAFDGLKTKMAERTAEDEARAAIDKRLLGIERAICLLRAMAGETNTNQFKSDIKPLLDELRDVVEPMIARMNGLPEPVRPELVEGADAAA